MAGETPAPPNFNWATSKFSADHYAAARCLCQHLCYELQGAASYHRVVDLLRISSRTIGSPVMLAGAGLFTARGCEVRILPCAAGVGEGLGIEFVVARGEGWERVLADVGRVVKGGRNTVLAGGDGKPCVMTTEHLLSAVVGAGITHARIELSGPEVPILDGSAVEFAEAITRAGIVEQRGLVQPMVIEQRHRLVFSDQQWIEVEPPLAGDEGACVYRYQLEYSLGDAASGAEELKQEASFRLDWQQPQIEAYVREVAPARTFCTLSEARQWKQAGLFGHVRPGDVLVLATAGQIADDATLVAACQRRMEDEPARHKLLDLMGDLALVGWPVIGRITAHRTGHEHNHAMARYLRQIAMG